MGQLRHECGVAAVYHDPRATIPSPLAPDGAASRVGRLVPRMLLDMQNRGQLAAGMSSFNPARPSLLTVHKDLGTVGEAFRLNRRDVFESLMAGLDGHAAIGHVRYATCGGDDLGQAQPFERHHGRTSRWFTFAYNGQLANVAQLRHDLLTTGDYHLKYDTDTEIVMHTISHELAEVHGRAADGRDAANNNSPVDWVEVFRRASKRWDGAYNIVLLSARGELVVVRDPLGIHPLCQAQDDSGALWAFASESVPLTNLGFRKVEPLPPGTLAILGPEGARFERFAEPVAPKHCFFEWIYFANVASVLDDQSVYVSRSRLGRRLAALEDVPIDVDTIVVPVPDTAKAAADAMAYALRVPSVEGLMRNRYLGRTFIEGNADRATRAKLKYTPIPEVLQGKRVLLVEDSIVRSTTLRALVHEMRTRGGAREIHLRVACPPIVAPCYYGIDMSTTDELFAPKFGLPDELENGGYPREVLDRMARELGADSLRYLSVSSLAEAIGKPVSHLCRACVTGNYPTPTGAELYRINAQQVPACSVSGADTTQAIRSGSAREAGSSSSRSGRRAYETSAPRGTG